jgi:NADPH2 dehydrogenase
MGMKDPLPTFTTFVERIGDEHPNLAYIHVVEPRVSGNTVVDASDENRAQSNEILRKTWGDRPYIAAGGMGRATAIDTVGKYGGLVAFGRHFLANVSRLLAVGVSLTETMLQPDLPLRLKEGLILDTL